MWSLLCLYYDAEVSEPQGSVGAQYREPGTTTATLAEHEDGGLLGDALVLILYILCPYGCAAAGAQLLVCSTITPGQLHPKMISVLWCP